MERASGARGGHEPSAMVDGERVLVLLEREVAEARVLVREVERRAELVDREIEANAEGASRAVRSATGAWARAARRSAVLGSLVGVGVAIAATGLIEVLTQWLR